MSQFKELKAGDEAQAFCCCSSKSECFKCWPGMVGLLICTLPLRVQISRSASCIGLAVDPDIVIVIVVWVALIRALESQVKDWPILPFFSHATAVLALFVMTLQIWQHPSSSR